VKIVFATDFHLDLEIPGYDLKARQEEALKELALECSDADLLVLGGDVFDNEHPSPWAYEQVIRLVGSLRNAGKKTFGGLTLDYSFLVVMLYGNHDLGTYGPLGALSNVLVVDTPSIHSVLGAKMLFAPYMPQSRSQVPLQAVYDGVFDEAAKKPVLAAFCHMSVPGAVGASELVLPESAPVIRPEKAAKFGNRVFNGHVHTVQRVGNVTMPGSLVPLSLGFDWDRMWCCGGWRARHHVLNVSDCAVEMFK
jgi:hypothetical protein